MTGYQEGDEVGMPLDPNRMMLGDDRAHGLIRVGVDLQVQIEQRSKRPQGTLGDDDPGYPATMVAIAYDGNGNAIRQVGVWRRLPLAASEVEAVYIAAAIETAKRLHPDHQ